MGKRVRVTSDRLNSYGTRVLTAGMDTEQYERNPVLLYMHERGKVIGYVKDLKKDDGEVTGELVFDCATELSRQCKRQWEFGSLKMVSAGLDVLELSDDKSLLAEGQTSPTITRSKLFEVSLVDIGANDDAIVLMRQGKKVTLGKGGENPLPSLAANKPTISTTQKQMDTKTLALLLGLPETADEAAVTAKVRDLQNAATRLAEVQAQLATLTLSRVESMVARAIAEKRLTPDKRDHFVDLGKKVGAEELEQVLAAMQPQVKLSAMIQSHEGAPAPAAYTKLSEVPADLLLSMRTDKPDEYRRLYRAEYGFDCEL